MTDDYLKLLHRSAGVQLAFHSPADPEAAARTVCAMANRFGGEILVYAEAEARTEAQGDSSETTAAPAAGAQHTAADDFNLLKAAAYTDRLTSLVTNEQLMQPSVPCMAQTVQSDGQVIVCVRVPPAPELLSWQGTVYVRRGSKDEPVSDPGELSRLRSHLGGQFAESGIYPYASIYDLHLEQLQEVRDLAAHSGLGLNWKDIGDQELLRRAGLHVTNLQSGQKGLNLAGILLLGKQDLIARILPAYVITLEAGGQVTELRCNLLTAVRELENFARTHVPECAGNDARSEQLMQVLREACVNMLIHQDYTSPLHAEVHIDSAGNSVIFTNPSRLCAFTPDTGAALPSCAKNPLMENFFRTLGLSGRRGSGLPFIISTCNEISGRPPVIINDEIFSLSVPLPESKSRPAATRPAPEAAAARAAAPAARTQPPAADSGSDGVSSDQKLNFFRNHELIRQEILRQNQQAQEAKSAAASAAAAAAARQHGGRSRRLTIPENQSAWLDFADPQIELLSCIKANPSYTVEQLADMLGWGKSRVKYYVNKLKEAQAIKRLGTDRKGSWQVFPR